MLFKDEFSLADYLSWTIDTDAELEDDAGNTNVTTLVEPGSNVLFISDGVKSFKVTIEEYGRVR